MQPKTNIDRELYQYAVKFGVREHPVLVKLRLATAKLTNSHMQIQPEQGQLMSLLAKLINAKSYLELGVFTGYSTLIMALAMGKDSHIVAIDNNPEYLAIADEYWTSAGVRGQINLIVDDALSACAKLCQKKNEYIFDIAFIDANKTAYPKYYEYCYTLVRPGGLIIIDNTLFNAQVLQDKPSNAANAIKDLNELVYNDQRVEICLLPIADGLTIAYKK